MKAKTAGEAIWETVAIRVGSNREHGWKQDDSMAAIKAAFEVETGEAISEDLANAIEMVVNPSAFRIKLEGMKRPDGETILKKSDKKEKAKGEHDKMFAQFLG